MNPNFIVDVTEADFEYEVLAHSQQVPVVVDFWAEWCGPCRVLGPILERLAEEADGEFRLAKVDVDENPNLAMRYDVRGIPAVKAFVNGQVAAEFVGAQPEPKIREFLREIAPSQGDLALEKGSSLLQLQRWEEAAETYREVLDEHPDDTAARLGLIQASIPLGRPDQAKELLKHFPASPEYGAAEKLHPLADALVLETEHPAADDDLLALTFERARQLILRGNLEAAMDGLLEVMRQDKRYRGDSPRKMMLGLFEILGDESETVRQYRSEMASILF